MQVSERWPIMARRSRVYVPPDVGFFETQWSWASSAPVPKGRGPLRYERTRSDWALFVCGKELANEVLNQDPDTYDVIIVDNMLPAALAAAELTSPPTVVLTHFLHQRFRHDPSATVWDLTVPLVDDTRSSLGLDPLGPGAALSLKLTEGRTWSCAAPRRPWTGQAGRGQPICAMSGRSARHHGATGIPRRTQNARWYL